MAEAIGLPQRDQLGIALDYLAEERGVGLFLLQAVREMAVQYVLAELLQALGLLGVVEVFEVAEAHVALRQAQQHRAGFAGFPPYRGARSRHAQRTAGGDAEGIEVFAGEEFADR
ncbi:hypothetical protein D3C81_1913280 [compost metagenome]